MEPRIQYCTAPDGVNLAFCTEGQGVPLVYMPTFAPLMHLQVQRLVPSYQHLFEYLTPRMNLIRYDRRGQGLSDRDPADISLDAHLNDLLAIIDSLALDRIALHSSVYGGPVAITFATRYPNRVSHLILANTAANMPDAISGSERARAMAGLLEDDWDLFVQVAARVVAGWSENEVASRIGAQARAGSTPERVREAQRVVRTWDASDVLPDVAAPALVMEYAGTSMFAERWTRAPAAAIPDAQLRQLDTQAATAQAIYEFVTGDVSEAPREPPPLPEGTAIILFTDIVDSTALTEQLGDAVFRDRATRLDAAMRTEIRECGGTPVEGKVLGDGVMAVFASARQAIDAAQRCAAAADGTGLALHLGLHAGDVIRQDDNVFGGAVNIASRICGLSAAGEILVSDVVRALARTSAGVTFEDRGEHALKGIADAQRIFAVRPG